jgi:hypothetical protein
MQASDEPGHKTAMSRDTTVTYNTLTLDGLNIFYREVGSKEKPTILLLHGFPSSSRRNTSAQLQMVSIAR